MKITLILPRGHMYRYHGGIFGKPIRYAPLTLVSLASLIPEEIEAKVEIIDEGIETIPEDINADLVGISCITGSANRAYEIADRIRQKETPVVLGGVHPTLMPQEAKQHADAVVSGFAEETWPSLLRDFTQNKMRPFYHQSPELSLANLPLARRELLKGKKYLRTSVVQATRGCIHTCDFCVVPYAWGKKMYFRPVEDVAQEIREQSEKDVIFVDVSPIENREYAINLFKALIPLRKNWVSPVTIKIAEDEELFSLAVKSGCKGVLIGFESTAQATLKRMGKHFNTAKKYREIVKKLHDHGIAVMGCFVFGFDNDDKEVFKAVTEFAYESNIDLPRYTLYTPYPGTPVFEKLKSEGRIIEKNWSLYDCQHAVFKPAQMSPEELEEGLHWAWRQSYSAWSILKRLAGSRCILHYAIPANIGYRLYGRQLKKYPAHVIKEMEPSMNYIES